MQIHPGRRWPAALVCAIACAFVLVGSAVAAEPAPAIDSLREIAGRIDTATRQTVAAHAEHRLVAQAAADATKRARGELDAIEHAASMQGFADDAVFVRKDRQVRKLLANLERAQAAAPDSELPMLIATTDARRTSRVVLADNRGTSCASALTIAPGDAIDTNLAAAGAAGSALWLRIAPAKHGYTRIDTAPTALDTEIALFSDRCPASDQEATARDDDSIGLAAAVAIDAAKGSGPRYARVRNLGRAGRVIARVETAGAFIGRVSDERTGDSIPAVVETLTADGFFGNAVYNDSNTGFYLMTADPGAYYVYAGNQYGYPGTYVAELYPDAPCSSPYVGPQFCDTADATLLTLADGQQRSGIDLALNLGGRIAGVVRDASSGAPIGGAAVWVYDESGNTVNYSNNYTDGAGRFLVGTLLTGNYYVTAGAAGYGGQVFNHIACGGPTANDCQPLSGTPVSVVRNQVSDGVDFDLPRSSHIVATVSARGNSAPPPYTWTLALFDSTGAFYNSYYGSGTQPIDAGPLPPGTYRAYASSTGFFSEMWNGIDCPNDCTPIIGQGTPIALAQGAEADLAFSLLPSPTVSGTITDATTHAPLTNIYVALFPVDPNQYGGAYAYTDNNGRYVAAGAPPGSYWVFASDSLHRPTLYPDAPCTSTSISSCDTSLATAVTIAYGGANVTGADIALPPNGTISGRLTVRTPPGMTLAPIAPAYAYVNVYDASGSYVTSSTTAEDGSYTVIGLTAQTYYAMSSGFGFDELYDGVDCTGTCNPLDGTPIALAQGQNVTGIDFDPIPNDYAFGRVRGVGNAPVAGVSIDLWSANGGTHCGVGTTNADGYYAVGDVTGQCYSANRLSTDVDPGVYVNEVYDGILCPNGSAWLGLCSLDGGSDVYFPHTPMFLIANFSLVQPQTIFVGDFEP